MDSCQRREAALPWYIQDPEGSCSRQGTCFRLRRGDLAKSNEGSKPNAIQVLLRAAHLRSSLAVRLLAQS